MIFPPECHSLDPWSSHKKYHINLNRKTPSSGGLGFEPKMSIGYEFTILTSHLPMLKMHKWQGEVPKMVMHYALCNFDYKTHWPDVVPT